MIPFLVRYQFTAAWVAYVAYLIVVFRLAEVLR